MITARYYRLSQLQRTYHEPRYDFTSYRSCLGETTTDSDSQSVHVKELGKHPIICLGAPGNSEGISRFGQEFTAAMENNFANPSDSWGNPPSLVPLIIPTSPAIHCTLSAANAVPSGSPFASHALSTAYFKPSISHQPIGRLTYASNSPSRTSLVTLPESKRGRLKGSAKIKPVTYSPRRRLRRPP
ncbi:uncharacterized protein LACBIDRAFT_299131 [Laccaria bicolor S238N-H82]|uniref:Predicted protein n=1 Tax=Laccaria bicolor (strain S238N-H82 / ATCC MYA-4686) TaxID=486041 RepID=B0DE49_LACBS|nr:uncharacterized protein LACBIDRAFT_299131 [Laccaria bicolor S238N-H82]EDR07326.1 predicted protein [Laccaria bicolor S238N-H82]|eukprot:XP_001882257.1 predicted protein [Laccaria bicolor S238N-H82]